MKYTRYDMKRGHSDKTFIVIILLVLILAFVFGTVIFKLLVRQPIKSDTKADTSVNTMDNTNNKTTKDISVDNKVVRFIAVQGGIYQNKENADAEINLLNKYGTPFTVTEDNKTRVLLGVYNEEQGEKIIKSLLEQKVENSKMLFTINNSDLCDIEITEIVNANIQVLNKLSEKNVKAIQTDELKKWCSSLEKVDNGSKNLSILNDMLEHVNKMPKELPKDKAGENYAYIYNIIKKIGSR